MEKTFVFDYDDTLAPNQEDYSLVHLEFTRWVIQKLGHKAPDVQSIINLEVKIDMEAAEKEGFKMTRFPSSLQKTYQTICGNLGIKAEEEDLKTAYKIGMSVYNENKWKERGLVEGAAETLDFLERQKDELILLTKGDPYIQNKKIIATGCDKRWFSKICIVQKKNKDVLLDAANRMHKEHVWHVGNSIRSDVKPALEAGIKMIYIPCETWAYEKGHNGKPQHPNLITFDKIIKIKENYHLLK